MDLTIIIPTYNRANKILRVLEALDNQLSNGFSYTVRVMDDGSKDNTVEVLAAYKPRNYRYFWDTQENTGAGGARNRMLAEVDTELVVIIGDDTIPAANFLEAHRNAHLAGHDNKLAVLGLTVWDKAEPITTVMVHIDGLGAQQFSYFYLKDGEYYDFRHFYTSNISIRTDFIRSINPIFRHDFVKYGFEDVEVGLRLEKKGMRILHKKDAVAFHDHFYSVRGFCRRQFNVGIAAQTLVELHPEVRKILAFKRISKYKKHSYMPWVRNDNRRFQASFGSCELFEREILSMLEAYETIQVQPLDAIYIALFDYFYFKGLANAILSEETRDRVMPLIARDMLLPAVRQFHFAASKGEFPIPSEAKEYFRRAFALSY